MFLLNSHFLRREKLTSGVGSPDAIKKTGAF